MPACGSPKLFAACHVLLRRSVPRHPPCALARLTRHLLLPVSPALYRTLHLVPRTPSHAHLQVPLLSTLSQASIQVPLRLAHAYQTGAPPRCTLRFPLPNQPRRSSSPQQVSPLKLPFSPTRVGSLCQIASHRCCSEGSANADDTHVSTGHRGSLEPLGGADKGRPSGAPGQVSAPSI